ncbi:hypothetical protein [Candidatus Paracaedibacter symbiosus]|uniref:hypothetical protein n=1 Tax=Candidatus Paracaedibacter symbiosus TaxID=244582 RepID=UPI000509A1F2|nr:hypothetical protein [Candidatus Paracaedibacter symbiosus]
MYFTLSLINLFISSVAFASSHQEEPDSVILAKVTSRFEQYQNKVSELEEIASGLTEEIARVEDEKSVLEKELNDFNEFFVNKLMKGSPYYLAYVRSHFTNSNNQTILRQKASQNINLSDLPTYHQKAVRKDTKTSVNELIFLFENLGGVRGNQQANLPSITYVNTGSPITPTNELDNADKTITAIRRRAGLETKGTSIRRGMNFDEQNEGTTSSIITSSSIIQPTSSVVAPSTLLTNYDATVEPGATEEAES